ncbi:MAG: hypothetical protein ACYDBV_13495 [Nitrospiria bacterium]
MTEINVLFKNKKGVESIHRMPLKQYLQAKVVMPNNYFPADEEAKRLVEKVDLKIVPVGTTQEDVKRFEETKGSIRTKKTTQFDTMLESIQSGKDVIDIPDEIEKPEVPEISFPNPVKEEKPKYSKDDLDSMTPDQLDAVIAELPLVESMKQMVRKIKTKSEKIEQVVKLLG